MAIFKRNGGDLELLPGFWWGVRGVMKGKFWLTTLAWVAMALWGVMRALKLEG